jgi:hypothetical protein
METKRSLRALLIAASIGLGCANANAEQPGLLVFEAGEVITVHEDAAPPPEDPLDHEGSDDGGACPIDQSYDPKVDPSRFVAKIDNPYFPLIPGTTFRHREGAENTVEVTVLSEKKMILGVSCTVVHDVVRESGEVIEDTFDWFAQDASGGVWYFGEDTKEYERRAWW